MKWWLSIGFTVGCDVGSVCKVVFELLTNAGFRNLPSEADWAKSNGNDYDDEIYKLLKKHRAAGLPTQKNTAMNIIAQQKQSWKYSKLSGLRFLDWLSSQSNADSAMKEMYLYASSQSDKSSVYYKIS